MMMLQCIYGGPPILATTWEDISTNIPAGPVNVIREDPKDEKILYLGTDVGVYVSKDSGENWEVLGDLPCTYVHDLAIQPRENMIIIATHGRGMFVLDADPVNSEKEDEKKKYVSPNNLELSKLLLLIFR